MASATTAAAVKAAVKPAEVSVLAPDAPAAAMPMAVNAAVPSAAPTWVADPARPDASPVCVVRHRGGDDHGGRHEAQRDTDGDEQQPGKDRDRVPVLRPVHARATGGRRPGSPGRRPWCAADRGRAAPEAGARARRRSRSTDVGTMASPARWGAMARACCRYRATSTNAEARAAPPRRARATPVLSTRERKSSSGTSGSAVRRSTYDEGRQQHGEAGEAGEDGRGGPAAPGDTESAWTRAMTAPVMVSCAAPVEPASGTAVDPPRARAGPGRRR